MELTINTSMNDYSEYFQYLDSIDPGDMPFIKVQSADMLKKRFQTLGDQEARQIASKWILTLKKPGISEAPINIPDYKTDDMGYVQSVYKGDQTGNKYSGQGPSIKLGKIPGLNLEHELFQDENGNIQIYHSIDPYEDPQTFTDKLKNIGSKAFMANSRKPLGFMSVRPYRDGYIGNTVATDPNHRDKGIASKLLIALIGYLGKPFYFGRQTSPAGKQFTKSIIDKTRGKFRAVGYDQQQRKDFELDNVDDLYTDHPGFSQDPMDRDSYDKEEVQKALSDTQLIKLIPENYVKPEDIVEDYIAEAQIENSLSSNKLAGLIWDHTDDKEIAKEFLDVVWDLYFSNFKVRHGLRDADLILPGQKGLPNPRTYRDEDIDTLNSWLQSKGLKSAFKILKLDIDTSIPPKYQKNSLRFQVEVNAKRRALGEEYSADKYPTLKDFAVMIKKHLGREKALEFYYQDWEHQNDANSEMLTAMGTDPLELDTEWANNWLKQHRVPYRVRRMFTDSNWEIYFDLIATDQPLSGNTQIH